MTRHDRQDRTQPGDSEANTAEEPGGITCAEAAERLYEYLDAELDDESAQAVREHLRVCEACYPRLAFEESFRALVRRVEEGREASDRLKGRVLDALRREGFGDSESP